MWQGNDTRKRTLRQRYTKSVENSKQFFEKLSNGFGHLNHLGTNLKREKMKEKDRRKTKKAEG